MSAHVCCAVNAVSDQDATRREKAGEAKRSGLARAGALVSWIGPGALLVLLPKCPMCLAAYFALAGIGVSMTAAAGLRAGVMVLCLSILAYRLARAGVRMTTSNPSNRSALPF